MKKMLLRFTDHQQYLEKLILFFETLQTRMFYSLLQILEAFFRTKMAKWPNLRSLDSLSADKSLLITIL